VGGGRFGGQEACIRGQIPAGIASDFSYSCAGQLWGLRLTWLSWCPTSSVLWIPSVFCSGLLKDRQKQSEVYALSASLQPIGRRVQWVKKYECSGLPIFRETGWQTFCVYLRSPRRIQHYCLLSYLTVPCPLKSSPQWGGRPKDYLSPCLRLYYMWTPH
jgi:hypothetical protein